MTKKKGDSVEEGHNNNRKSMMAAAVAPAAFDDKSAAGGDTMECIFEYKANLFDELGLGTFYYFSSLTWQTKTNLIDIIYTCRGGR